MPQEDLERVAYLRGVQDCADHVESRLRWILEQHLIKNISPNEEIRFEVPNVLALRMAIFDLGDRMTAVSETITDRRSAAFGKIFDELTDDGGDRQ